MADVIIQRYGPTTLHQFRHWERVHFKHMRTQCDIEFLTSCIKHDLFPKFVQFRLYDRGIQTSRLYRNCQRRFLSNERTRKVKLKQTLSLELEYLRSALRASTSILDFYHLQKLIIRTSENSINKVKSIHLKKLINLGLPNTNSLSPDSVIFNYSHRVLSSHEKSVLALGLKFALPISRPDFYTHFLSCEKFFDRLKDLDMRVPPGGNQPSFKHSYKHLCLSGFYSFKRSFKDFRFSKEEWGALKSLKDDKSICIMKPDKGNGIVLLNRVDYVQKMDSILRDTDKFLGIKGDLYPLILKNEDKLNRFLRQLKEKGSIGDRVYHQVYASGSKPGILYGLPKVHKSDIPLRPILSAIGTHNYQLAKYLGPIINPITVNEYTVTDSFNFVKEVMGLDTSNSVMASFDVVSLFTNIPLNETIDICVNSLMDLGLLPGSMSHMDFKKLLTLAVKDVLFRFNDSTYTQIDGVAMGSPLAPILANAFMSYYEKLWLDNCPTEFRPSFYRRYVDDTFLLFRDIEHVPLFLEYLNSQHSHIKFTHEVEIQGKLSFLDVLVSRSESGFTTSVFRKKTFTGLGMKFSSFLPSFYKSGLIKNLVHRAYKICSNYDNLDLELKFLTKYFVNNGFPEGLVESCIGKALTTHFTYVPRSVDTGGGHVFSIPFYGSSSYAFRNKVTKLLKDFYPSEKFRVVFTKSLTLASFFRYKDQVPKALQSSVVYKYVCEDCNASYVGQTSRHLKTRIAEHKGISPRTGRPYSSPTFSAIREHSLSAGHLIKDSSFSVLRSSNSFDLLILESLYTVNLKPSLSLMESSTELVCF